MVASFLALHFFMLGNGSMNTGLTPVARAAVVVAKRCALWPPRFLRVGVPRKAELMIK